MTELKEDGLGHLFSPGYQPVCRQTGLFSSLVNPALHLTDNPGAAFPRVLLPIRVCIRFSHWHPCTRSRSSNRRGNTVFQTVDSRGGVCGSFQANSLLGISGLWAVGSFPASWTGAVGSLTCAPTPSRAPGSLWLSSSLVYLEWLLLFSEP